MPVFAQYDPIELHPDCDEKKTQQNVMERLDVFFDPVFEVGLGDEHPDEKRAHRERKSGVFRHPRESKNEQEHIQEKKLFALSAVDDLEPTTNHLVPAPEQQKHKGNPLGKSDRQHLPEIPVVDIAQ